ncbi:MAG: phosphate acyltransferase PlsX [Caldilineaceae bacterium]|nr:phosphate acyltransferase PlsX [Caldilineaceae bacterium]HRJ41683.1 phosphate acyltransferase PlsX [Caldilineaceae bacterium]
MNIALDVMGGDHAPQEVIAGAVVAAREYGVAVSLVGKPDVIARELSKHDVRGLKLPIIPASEVIEMEDKPATAVRTKKNSSMVVACQLVKAGKADAFVTAGNTGGALAAGILHIGRMKGIQRPALIVPFPTQTGFCLLLDVGANVDVKPEHLQQFGVMGSIYSKRIMGVRSPTVRILSNGEEQGKGSQLVLEATALLEKTPGITFLGNIEGRDIVNDLADVVVTDGFTGNVLIKTAEGVGKLIRTILVEEITATPISSLGGLLAKSALRRLARRVDDSEYGGAVLLGLSNLLVVAHGRSNAHAIRHAIRVAKQAIDFKIVDEIQAGVQEIADSAPVRQSQAI